MEVTAAKLMVALRNRLPADPWEIIAAGSSLYTLADYNDANLVLDALDIVGRNRKEGTYGLN